MEIRIEALDLVTLLVCLRLLLCLGTLAMGIVIGGADRSGEGVSWLRKHFFQIRILIRKTASVIRIMSVGEGKVQWTSAGVVWSSCLNSLLVSNLPLYFILSSWIVWWITSLLAHLKSSISSPAQPMFFIWIFTHLWFVCRDHMIQGPDIASWVDLDCVTGLELGWFDHVLSQTYFICVNCLHQAYGQGIFCQFKICLPGLSYLELWSGWL